jgi:hypothetical protein
MLKGLVEVKSEEKHRVFQVLLLNNDKSQDVKVQETDRIDFMRVEDHLKHGGSIFITRKSSQKLTLPKENKLRRNKNDTGTSTSFFFDHI